ncbi:MAG: SRPBCC family protein [Acidobacteria bacterium]|nr:SRPBCC family protein [Acidobacteriota bacterium]MDW7984555.1 SRPBCC family protein [Acidobacteriota bacterium]
MIRVGLAMTFLTPSVSTLQADESRRAGPTVSVTEAQGLYTVSARLWVPAPPAAVWGVLTDYDRIAEFTHGIEVSRLIERQSNVCVVEQQGRGILGIGLRVRLRVVEQPPAEIQFEALEGDFQVYRGSFRLEARGGGTEVTYMLESQGKFWIPSWLGRSLIRSRVQRILKDIGAEVLRRYAES